MITPMIHRQLSRDDLAALVAEIGRYDRSAGLKAQMILEHGDVDTLLDSRAALEAVQGNGGTPAALPLALLWYVPVRAALGERGVTDIGIADYTATLPVAFIAARTAGAGKESAGLDAWWRSIDALPPETIAQAERAADSAALALWLAGCFPEWVTRGANGEGMLRAYVTFAQQALSLAGRILSGHVAGSEAFWERAADRAQVMRESLAEVRSDYLGRDAHTPQGRIERFLARLSPDADRQRRSFDH